MMKTQLALAIALLGLTSSYAQPDMSMSELMRCERLGAYDAASITAISRGLNLDANYILRTQQALRVSAWKLAPAFYISEATGRSVRDVLSEHYRRTWDEIESGYYSDPRRTAAPRHPGYSDAYDYDNSYRSSRSRRVVVDDREYERKLWERLLGRGYGRAAAESVCWIDRGRSFADLALAAHVGRVSGADPNDVLFEFSRVRSWERVRQMFGLSTDWGTRERRVRYSPRDRFDGRDRLEDLADIIIRR
jgi:hypothetical protein